MLDPYAPLVASLQLPEGVHLVSRAGKAASKPQNAPALLGSLAYLQESFDWGQDRAPKTPLVDSIILEVDVPSFSAEDASVPPDHRGTAHDGRCSCFACGVHGAPGNGSCPGSASGIRASSMPAQLGGAPVLAKKQLLQDQPSLASSGCMLGSPLPLLAACTSVTW